MFKLQTIQTVHLPPSTLQSGSVPSLIQEQKSDNIQTLLNIPVVISSNNTLQNLNSTLEGYGLDKVGYKDFETLQTHNEISDEFSKIVTKQYMKRHLELFLAGQPAWYIGGFKNIVYENMGYDKLSSEERGRLIEENSNYEWLAENILLHMCNDSVASIFGYDFGTQNDNYYIFGIYEE